MKLSVISSLGPLKLGYPLQKVIDGFNGKLLPMKYQVHLFFLLLFLSLLACDTGNSYRNTPSEAQAKPIKVIYPENAPDTSVVEKYHAVNVSDSYRWLESYSSNTGRWLAEQNSLSSQYFDQIDLHEVLQKEARKYWDYERFSLPIKKGGYYFYAKNDGLQQQDIWYRIKGAQGKIQEILDPNDLRNGQILQDAKPSGNGRFLAFQVADNGSSWRKIKIKDLENERMLSDEIDGVKHSCVAWHGEGFYYARYDQKAKNKRLGSKDLFHQLYYHKLGTPQAEDEMIFADRSNPYSIVDIHTTHDEQFLIMEVKKNTLGNAFWFKKLDDENAEFKVGAAPYDYEYHIIDNVGENFLIKTTFGAPKGRLIMMNANAPNPDNWQEIIPESEDVMQSVELVNNKIVACFLRKTYSVAKVYSTSGEYIGNLNLPEKGKVNCFEGEKDENLAFFGFSTLTKPMSVYAVDVDQMNIRPYWQPKAAVRLDGYTIELVPVPNSDGIKVPMYVVHRKGLPRDGNQPTLLVVNGGLEEQLLPEFNPTGLNLLPFIVENGGIFAMVNVRGGKELGRNWQLAGMSYRKQKGIEDFKAAAQYLFNNNYSNKDKLAIYGRGNGGLIAGAAAVQQPEMIKVLITEDGIFDALRYDKFSIGWMWKREFGDCQDKKNFDNMYSYSPIHNIVDHSFPASLVIAGQQNDIIVPWHSYKFVAELQTHQQGDAPILLQTDNDGYIVENITNLDNRIQRSVDILAFMYYNLEGQLLK